MRTENMDRGKAPPGDVLAFGSFRIHPDRHLLLKGGRPVPIGSRALEILLELVIHAGELVTKEQLIARAWPDTVVDESNLRAQVASLRKTLGDGRRGARYVVAVPGRGYRFTASVSRVGGADAASSRDVVRAGNLPIRLSRTIGRDDVVRALGERMMRRRLLTITGPGGIGKTTVAVSVAATLLARHPDGACFVDLGTIANPDLVPDAVATALGLGSIADHPGEAIASFLRDRALLLVLDSCEHCVAAVAALAEETLGAAPGVRILATSREPLRADGESVHRLPPLDTPAVVAGLTAAQAMTSPAVELFVERVSASLNGFELGDRDAQLVAEICRQLDGLPLAIELAAGRVAAFGIRGVAERLHDRFRLLTGGRRTALPRHQTILATLEWSHALLSEPERILLRRCAIFVGATTLASIEAVTADAGLAPNDIADTLAQLVAKSLASADVDGSVARYRLLATTRAYALDRLAESGELPVVARRHATHVRDLLQLAMTEWDTASTAEWVRSYAPQIDNVRAALDWAFLADSDAELGVDLTAAAIPLWFQLSLTDECRVGVQRALDRLTPGDSRDARLRQIMQLYMALGLSRTFTVGLAPQATAAWRKALEIAQSLGDKGGELEALWGLWFCQIGTSEYRSALETARRYCDAADSAADVALGHRLVAVPLHCLGDHARARTHLEPSLTDGPAPAEPPSGRRFRFDQPFAAGVMLAQMLWLQGFADQASAVAQQRLAEASRTGHSISVCDALAQAVCPIALWVGDLSALADAVALLRARTADQVLGPWSILGRCWEGALLIRRDGPDAGLATLQSAVEELEHVRFGFYQTGFLACLAEGLAAGGSIVHGLTVIERALEQCTRREELWCLAELLRVKGEILLQGSTRDTARAEQQFVHAVECARRQGELAWELRATVSLARLRQQTGNGQDVIDALASVYARFGEGFATSDLIAARSLLDARS